MFTTRYGGAGLARDEILWPRTTIGMAYWPPTLDQKDLAIRISVSSTGDFWVDLAHPDWQGKCDWALSMITWTACDLHGADER